MTRMNDEQLASKVRELQNLIARHTSAKKSKEAFLKDMERAATNLRSTNMSDYSPALQLPTDKDVREIMNDLRQLPERIRLLKSELSIQEPDA